MSYGYEVFVINGSLFIEEVGQNSTTDIPTILFVALGKQARDHHEKSNRNLIHLLPLVVRFPIRPVYTYFDVCAAGMIAVANALPG
jgi:hypothetical protein